MIAIARRLLTVERTEIFGTPSDKIQSCQGISSGMSWTTGAKGLCPRTRISWIMKMQGNGAWRWPCRGTAEDWVH